MIIVTGATGKLGGAVVELLLEQVPAGEIGVSVRSAEKAAAFQERGVRVRQADFADPASLRNAFEGASQVLIVSVNALGDEAIRQHGNAIQAAKDVGAERILYTSHQAASPSSAVAFARDHAATEALLQSSGVPFVSLRNGFYAESALYQLGGMQDTGRLALPEDGPVSWTDRSDLAVAAVAALVDTGLFDGVTPPLTASEALDFAGIAELASEILGRDIARIVVSDDEYRTAQLAHGYPEWMVDMLGTLFRATKAREFDVIDPTLERILGRQPVSMRDVLVNHFASGSAI